MSDSTAIIIAAVAALPPTITALLSLFATRDVHRRINSRMDELLKAARGEATAEGREIGRKEVK